MRRSSKSGIFYRTVFLVLVGLLASTVIWIQARPHAYHAEFGYLWSNALQVANPEYQLTFKGDVKQEFFYLDMKVDVDSHSLATASEPAERVVEISEDWFGRIDFKSLPGNPMTHHLKTFGGGGGSDSQDKDKAMAQAGALKADEFATVLVELSTPMSEADVEKAFGLDFGEWKRFFLSGSRPSSEKPVYWWPGRGGCTATFLVDPRCGDHSAVSQFRQWVSRLSDDDQGSLAKLGLDLQHLRHAAAQGQVFGFIANTFSQRQMIDLLSKPEVRTIRIVEHWVEDEE
jgi:hypothetical protein